METFTIMKIVNGTWGIVVSRPVLASNGSSPKIAGRMAIYVWIQPYPKSLQFLLNAEFRIQNCWVMEIAMVVTTTLCFVIGILEIAVLKPVGKKVGTSHFHVVEADLPVWIQLFHSVHPFRTGVLSPMDHTWAMAFAIVENTMFRNVDGILATVARHPVRRQFGPNNIGVDLLVMPVWIHPQQNVHKYQIVPSILQTCWVMVNVMEATTIVPIVYGIWVIVVRRLVEMGVGTNRLLAASMVLRVWIHLYPSLRPFQMTALLNFPPDWEMAIVMEETTTLRFVSGILATAVFKPVDLLTGTNHSGAVIVGLTVRIQV